MTTPVRTPMTPVPERPAMARRMRSNVRWNLFGNVAYAIGQWLQLVIFARLGGPAAVGAYALALALTAPVMMFGYLQLRTLLAIDARGSYEFREYRRLRVATTIAALAAISLIAWFMGDGRDVWPILVPVCAMRAADALADIYYGVWQRHERMSVIGWGLVLNAVASVVFMAVLAMLGGGAPGAATGAALGSCAALAFVMFRTATDAELRSSVSPGTGPVDGRRLRRLAIEATPLGFIVLLGSLQTNVPRYFVQHHAGESALGLFATASQLTAAGTIVVGALGSAAMPRLGRLCAAGDAVSFRALARKLVLGGALLGVLGVALSASIGRRVLVLLFRPEFGSASHMLVVLSAAAGLGFVATLLGYVLTGARAIAVQPLLLAVTLVVEVAFCAVLTPSQGAIGAAWAIVAGSAMQALWSAVALGRVRIGAAADGRAVEAA